ncbi:MAG: B12-binding domain-containing protein [Actinomycetota bacterium]|nr:B12-binding domain-containing protein [Actinomycetota bacterium]
MGGDEEGRSRVGEGLSIRTVSEALGVPAPTLRSWERRYGLPTTLRSSGGHRRYTEEALTELRLMRDEVARGRRAGDAARVVRVLLHQTGPGNARINRLLAASQRLDPAAVRAVLDQATDEIGLAATLDQVLMPAMRQIGTWWETGRCDVAQEHLTTEAARGWLARMTALAPGPISERPILLACGPRDLHTLGLEALAALLTRQRCGCRVLGARTPQRTLVTAVTATSAAAVVIVSHLSTQRRPAADAIRAVASTGCPTFYAGNAFLFPRARSGTPGTYLGENLAAATALIRESLSV